MFVQGKDIPGRTHTSIRLFSICQAMEWSHLPVAGGIYDQHPQLIDDFMVIFNKKHQWEEQERKREKAKTERQKMQQMRHGRK